MGGNIYFLERGMGPYFGRQNQEIRTLSANISIKVGSILVFKYLIFFSIAYSVKPYPAETESDKPLPPV